RLTHGGRRSAEGRPLSLGPARTAQLTEFRPAPSDKCLPVVEPRLPLINVGTPGLIHTRWPLMHPRASAPLVHLGPRLMRRRTAVREPRRPLVDADGRLVQHHFLVEIRAAGLRTTGLLPRGRWCSRAALVGPGRLLLERRARTGLPACLDGLGPVGR